jgi:hypothetical protein
MQLARMQLQHAPADEPAIVDLHVLLEAVGVTPWHARAHRSYLKMGEGALEHLGLVKIRSAPAGRYLLRSCLHSSNAPARRCHTGPNGSNTTQGRLAADKRVRPGDVPP